MAYIEVDVDIDEFETEDLVNEVIRRLDKKGRKGITPKQLARIKNVVSKLNEELGTTLLPIKSLDDQLKYDCLTKNWDRFTCSELEERLK